MQRVRKALFDILRPRIEDAKFLDLFSGTGSVGIEALSEGAAHTTFVELDRAAHQTVLENVKHCGFNSKASVLKTDVFAFLKKAREGYDIIYIDPPQSGASWIQTLQMIAERPELLNQEGQIVVKVHPDGYETLSLTRFVEVDQRRYGNSLLVFFEHGAH